jgi:WD40 repeat protein
MTDRRQRVRSVAVLSQGLVVSGSEDFTVRVWDPSSGTCLKKLTAETEVSV